MTNVLVIIYYCLDIPNPIQYSINLKRFINICTFLQLFICKNVCVLDAANISILYGSMLMLTYKTIHVLEPNAYCMFTHEITLAIGANVIGHFCLKRIQHWCQLKDYRHLNVCTKMPSSFNTDSKQDQLMRITDLFVL